MSFLLRLRKKQHGFSCNSLKIVEVNVVFVSVHAFKHLLIPLFISVCTLHVIIMFSKPSNPSFYGMSKELVRSCVITIQQRLCTSSKFVYSFTNTCC